MSPTTATAPASAKGAPQLPASVPASVYDENFYSDQGESSYISAKKYVAILVPLLDVRRIVDVGCGRGTWLKAFKEGGAGELVGLDGPWNTQGRMIESSIEFHPVDLNKPLDVLANRRFDLAMSLEVAEHLHPSSASSFVASLANLSDVVLFGAAYTLQGGTNHINEQPHTYWADHFLSHGYVPFDLFRPVLWGSPEVDFWYQQNTFLYVREKSGAFGHLTGKSVSPIANTAFMNCVHPVLYNIHSDERTIVRRFIKSLIPKTLMPAAKKVRRYFR
ncbi:MAG: methyltransferase domain-containing protein [Reyranella sp.]